MTFDSKASANRWLALCEADILRGTWDDPLAKGEPLGLYAARWIRERPGLSERSVRFYDGLLSLHIEPTLGSYALKEITSADVRAWRQGLLDNRTSERSARRWASRAGRRRSRLSHAIDGRPFDAANTSQFRPTLKGSYGETVTGEVAPRRKKLHLSLDRTKSNRSQSGVTMTFHYEYTRGDIERDLLTVAETAELLRTPVATLRYWRHLGTGPHSFRVGRRVLYRADDVQAWLDALHDGPDIGWRSK